MGVSVNLLGIYLPGWGMGQAGLVTSLTQCRRDPRVGLGLTWSPAGLIMPAIVNVDGWVGVV